MTLTPEEQRMRFIYTIRSKGVMDEVVLAAMEATPREMFLEGTFFERAYEDRPLPIHCGQTISQPSVVAMMTQALELNKRCKVLEVGTGSGYQAAVLSKLSRRVYTVERYGALAANAKKVLQNLDLGNVTVVTGDGSLGLPEQAPFDRILVTAAAEDPPATLLEQLKVGGIMVLPVGQSDTVQTLIKVIKTEDDIEYIEMGEVRFVPLVEGVA